MELGIDLKELLKLGLVSLQDLPYLLLKYVTSQNQVTQLYLNILNGLDLVVVALFLIRIEAVIVH